MPCSYTNPTPYYKYGITASRYGLTGLARRCLKCYLDETKKKTSAGFSVNRCRSFNFSQHMSGGAGSTHKFNSVGVLTSVNICLVVPVQLINLTSVMPPVVSKFQADLV